MTGKFVDSRAMPGNVKMIGDLDSVTAPHPLFPSRGEGKILIEGVAPPLDSNPCLRLVKFGNWDLVVPVMAGLTFRVDYANMCQRCAGYSGGEG